MPTHEELLRDLKVRATKLKELGAGLRVGRVLGERVLVKTIIPRTELDEVEKRGLIKIPESVRSAYNPLATTGIIIAIGEGVPLLGGTFTKEGLIPDHVVKEGDMILFSKLAGMDFTINEQDLRIIQVKEILCVLVDTDQSVVEVKA